MARIENENPKKCKRCIFYNIFYNSCQNNPNICEDFVNKKAETDKKMETADDKAKRRKDYHKWLKSILSLEDC